LAGIGKIVVVGGSEQELKGWGATHVLDRHGGDEVLLKRIRDVVGEDLLYAFDPVNPPESQHIAISALSSSKTGTVARLVSFLGDYDESKIIGEKKAGYEMRSVIGLSQAKPETAKPFWDRLENYLTEKIIVPNPYKVVDGLNAEKVNEVLDRYRDGKRVVQTQFRVSE
jgi:NADPH2:quinone reductase